MDPSTTPESPSIRELGEKVKSDLHELRGVAEKRKDELFGELRALVGRHPFASVGAAFGAGYVLSGALLSRTTARAVRLGLRIYLGRLIKSTLGAELGHVLGVDRGDGGMGGGVNA
jgi:hypothetical protein